jgi:hypothetical protein
LWNGTIRERELFTDKVGIPFRLEEQYKKSEYVSCHINRDERKTLNDVNDVIPLEYCDGAEVGIQHPRVYLAYSNRPAAQRANRFLVRR